MNSEERSANLVYYENQKIRTQHHIFDLTKE